MRKGQFLSNYNDLVKEYLQSPEARDKGIWEDRNIKVMRMYRALSRLNASDLTFFLLCIEYGNISKVARQLGVHRNTMTRQYHRIKDRITTEIWQTNKI